jgi:hypothetical protein
VSSGKSASGPALRPGDVVEVRPAAEILATLGRDGALKGMPFMPEMLAHVGKRYTVTRRVDKICNMVDESGSRRMRDTVYLADLRCDGSRHGGCQAGCKIYWKEAWLRRVDDGPLPPETGSGDAAELDRVAEAATKANRPDIWRCQATEALKASEPLKRSDLRQYWREATNGNFGRLRLAGLLIRAFVMECAFHLGVVRPLPLQGPGQNAASGPLLNLQPGEIVEVRAPKEIEATLDRSGHNRGLSFDREMLPLCGRTFRVRQKVRRIIDESTGRMLTIPKDCVILEGAACSGERSVGRWFCPREIYPFWRESWLKRVDDQELHHSGPRLPKPDREAIDSESQLESGGRH